MSELSDRLLLIATSLATALPTRVVTRDLLDFSQRSEAELQQGIYTLVSGPEEGFQNLLSRAAMDGNHKLLLVGQIKVEETKNANGFPETSKVEDAELVMVDEIKGWLRSLPAVLCRLQVTGFRNSQQMEYPYGWVAFDLVFIR